MSSNFFLIIQSLIGIAVIIIEDSNVEIIRRYAEQNSEIKIISKKVKTIFETSIKPNSSGAYITIPQKFNFHKAFVVVMQEKIV